MNSKLGNGFSGGLGLIASRSPTGEWVLMVLPVASHTGALFTNGYSKALIREFAPRMGIAKSYEWG